MRSMGIGWSLTVDNRDSNDSKIRIRIPFKASFEQDPIIKLFSSWLRMMSRIWHNLPDYLNLGIIFMLRMRVFNSDLNVESVIGEEKIHVTNSVHGAGRGTSKGPQIRKPKPSGNGSKGLKLGIYKDGPKAGLGSVSFRFTMNHGRKKKGAGQWVT